MWMTLSANATPGRGEGSDRVEVDAIVATDHPLSAYGGIRIADRVLHELADGIRSGALPMLVEHDIRRPLRPHILDVQVRSRPDGFKEVWVRFTVEASAWAEFNTEVETAGGPGGFSFAATERIGELSAAGDRTTTSIEIDADASYWNDETLLNAAAQLRAVGPVRVARRYQFALEPLAVVAVTFVIAPILAGLAANALYDGLKRFLRPKKPTIFQFRVENADGTSANARVETDNAEVLKRAIDSFDQIAARQHLSEWNEAKGAWEQHPGMVGSTEHTPVGISMPITDPNEPPRIHFDQMGITEIAQGIELARRAWNTLQSAGHEALSVGAEYRSEHLVLSGFFARAQGLYEGAVAAIEAGNPYSAFSLIRAYAENAAAILYVKDHPSELAKLLRDTDEPGLEMGTVVEYARTRFRGFGNVYSELGKYAYPHASSILASYRVSDEGAIHWSSAPEFKSESDAMMACAWVIELTDATSDLVVEFARAVWPPES